MSDLMLFQSPQWYEQQIDDLKTGLAKEREAREKAEHWLALERQNVVLFKGEAVVLAAYWVAFKQAAKKVSDGGAKHSHDCFGGAGWCKCGLDDLQEAAKRRASGTSPEVVRVYERAESAETSLERSVNETRTAELALAKAERQIGGRADYDSMKQWADFGAQCYQDRCENAYIEASVVKLMTTELAAANARLAAMAVAEEGR